MSTSIIAAALLAVVGIGAAGAVSAATSTGATTSSTSSTHANHVGAGVRGTVASVSGNIITVTGKNGTTYTVDATSATFMKSVSGAKPTTATISDIAVGDTVSVRGTVSGDSVTATKVTDGVMTFTGRGGGKGHGVTGTVSAISGDTVTITNSNGTSYTVDATNAKVSEIVSLPVSGIKIGDKIGVQGTVSGTSVSATRITDGLVAPAPSTSTQ